MVRNRLRCLDQARRNHTPCVGDRKHRGPRVVGARLLRAGINRSPMNCSSELSFCSGTAIYRGRVFSRLHHGYDRVPAIRLFLHLAKSLSIVGTVPPCAWERSRWSFGWGTGGALPLGVRAAVFRVGGEEIQGPFDLWCGIVVWRGDQPLDRLRMLLIWRWIPPLAISIVTIDCLIDDPQRVPVRLVLGAFVFRRSSKND
jgi:hypothetical protein